ncbi:alpha/beta hydrolase [Planosporangium mesophilum]|uniref:alpha/beta hydrolase n=1 Tax=Planosporangium mesophilum TaxID=689768 RepID=UPI001438EE55|nr:alpha/beta hydrolase [Planosporangium mesophilum]NJC85695.1 alpha/beta hydrolase [Planosporangium mesophilum]
MAQIVLVHGIAQEQYSADDLESAWSPSLAGGVRRAGYDALADQLWPDRQDAGRPARMAFYGDLFLTPGLQGDGASADFTPDQLNTAVEIALAWLNNAKESPRPRDAGTARLELQALQEDPAGVQGRLSAAVSRIIAALDQVPWFSQVGLRAAARINKPLAQVVRYLTEPDIRAKAIKKVRKHLDADTRVVIGHSLGSVVAYEAIRDDQGPLPVLITLGSPLGLNAIVRRLQDRPKFPAGLARWVNLVARDDIVAARPDLAVVFDVDRPAGARFESTYTVDNGAQPHRANFYLTKTATGAAIAEAM